jgi:hypothetical protein
MDIGPFDDRLDNTRLVWRWCSARATVGGGAQGRVLVGLSERYAVVGHRSNLWPERRSARDDDSWGSWRLEIGCGRKVMGVASPDPGSLHSMSVTVPPLVRF